MKDEMYFSSFRWMGGGEILSLFFSEKKSWSCWLVAAAGAEHKTQLHAGWLLSLHGCTYVCKIVRKVVLSFSTSLHTHIRRTSTYSK